MSFLTVWWTQWTWPLKAISVIFVVAMLVIGIGLIRSCGKKAQPTLDLKAIEEAKQVIANADRKQMEDFKANVAANVALIDSNVANAKAAAVNAAADSRKDSANKTNDQLAQEIEQMLKDSQ